VSDYDEFESEFEAEEFKAEIKQMQAESQGVALDHAIYREASQHAVFDEWQIVSLLNQDAYFVDGCDLEADPKTGKCVCVILREKDEGTGKMCNHYYTLKNALIRLRHITPNLFLANVKGQSDD